MKLGERLRAKDGIEPAADTEPIRRSIDAEPKASDPVAVLRDRTQAAHKAVNSSKAASASSDSSSVLRRLENRRCRCSAA